MKLDHQPAATRPPPGFLDGLRVPWDGLRYMNRHPSLWRYGVVAVFLNLLITMAVLAGLIYGSVWLVNTWLPDWSGAWYGRVLWWLVVVALMVATAGGAFIAWVVLEGILCGHFYGKLAEQVERQIGLAHEEIQEIPITYQVVDAIRDAGFLAMAYGLCLAVQLFPGVGAIAGACGSAYFTASVLGMEYLDYPLSLRGWRLHEKRAFVKRHRPVTLGLGAAVTAMTFIPVLGSVMLTTAVTGAVLLHRRLREREDEA